MLANPLQQSSFKIMAKPHQISLNFLTNLFQFSFKGVTNPPTILVCRFLPTLPQISFQIFSRIHWVNLNKHKRNICCQTNTSHGNRCRIRHKIFANSLQEISFKILGKLHQISFKLLTNPFQFRFKVIINPPLLPHQIRFQILEIPIKFFLKASLISSRSVLALKFCLMFINVPNIVLSIVMLFIEND